MFRLKVSLIALALAGLAAAAPDALAQSKPTIGIAMPTKSSARWIDDGNNMVKVLKERGYGTDLQYADDDIPNQLSQVENMVTKGSKVLVIAAWLKLRGRSNGVAAHVALLLFKLQLAVHRTVGTLFIQHSTALLRRMLW